jgi:hypothetical protein
VDQRALDSAARALVVEILSDTRNTDEIEHAAYEAASEAVQLDIKIAEAEAVAEALTDRLGRGEITLARYDLVIKPVDERIASLRAERAALPDPGPVPGAQQSLGTSRAQWRQRWDTADYKGKSCGHPGCGISTWDEVMAVVKAAVDAVAARAPRVSVTLKADIRPGVTGALQAKVEALEQYLDS